jgi:hypothetical protein
MLESIIRNENQSYEVNQQSDVCNDQTYFTNIPELIKIASVLLVE